MSNTPEDKTIHLRVILKSGKEFTMKVKNYTVKWGDSLDSIHVEGCTENFPVYIDLDEVAGIVRVFSNEEVKEDEAEN